MTQPFAAQAAATPGQPSSVRMGTVLSVSPLTVDVQGATVTNVGAVAGVEPITGSSVALLGQSPSSGTDPTSWLVLGEVAPSSNLSALSQDPVETFSDALSAAIGTTLTIVMTTPVVTWPANWAWRIEFEGGIRGNTANSFGDMRIFRDNTTAVTIFEWYRITWPAVNQVMNAYSSRVMRTGPTAVTCAISLGIAAGAGTTTLFATASSPRILRATPIGPASRYPSASLLT